VNNDANCFALGEYHFGKGKGKENMIGLTIGTGLGAGAIVHKHLFAGPNCGVGEFGMVDYLDHNYEYYASGQYFSNVYHVNGEEVFDRANAGDEIALQYYAELGTHLGNAIKLIMYTYDADYIVLGGSVRHALKYFQKTMWVQIQTFAYSHSVANLKIELSELENAGILGAAGLYLDQL
jgi:glucokinase